MAEVKLAAAHPALALLARQAALITVMLQVQLPDAAYAVTVGKVVDEVDAEIEKAQAPGRRSGPGQASGACRP